MDERLDERESVALFAGELQAILPLLRGHVATLQAPPPLSHDGRWALAATECARLLDALTALSAGFHADDCAALGRALLIAGVPSAGAPHVGYEGTRPAAPTVALALDYLAARAETFARFRRVLPPSPAEHAMWSRLLGALNAAEANAARDWYEEPADGRASGELELEQNAALGQDAALEGLSEDDQEMIRAFRSSRLIGPAAPSSGAVPLAAPNAPDAPDDMYEAFDVLDDIPPELRESVRRDTAEDLRHLRLELLQLEQVPSDTGVLAQMRRDAHKLKGAAAQFGFGALAEMALALEETLAGLDGRGGQVAPSALDGVAELLDLMEAARDLVGDSPVESASLRQHAARNAAAGNASLPLGNAVAGRHEGTSPRLVTESMRESTVNLAQHELDGVTSHLHALTLAGASLAHSREEALQAHADLERVAERLRHVTGEVVEIGALDGPPPAALRSARDATSGVSGIHARGDERESPPIRHPRASSSAPGWGAAPEGELSQAANALREIVSDLAAAGVALRGALGRLAEAGTEQRTAADELQRAITRMRLVPLGELLPQLHFEVARLQRVSGKQASLRMDGAAVGIDRAVCEALREPITQILRNAVLHGIETPEERRAAGKPERGALWISAFCLGSDIVIEIGDDGRGVSSPHLVAAARAAGVIGPEEPATFSESRMLELMFEPSVTTIGGARMLGGRGIGLDEARTALSRLGGTIGVRSVAGAGSVFRIQAPISLSSMRALHVRSAGQLYALPFGAVERTALLRADAIHAHETAGAPEAHGAIPSGSARYAPIPFAHAQGPDSAGEGEVLPVFTLGELLGDWDPPRTQMYALVIATERGRAAVLVEDVEETRDILVRSLPRHLSRRALRGTTVTAAGELALIVDVALLLERTLSGDQPKLVRREPAAATDASAPLVLVVDDSESIRRALELLLRRGGFAVELARDGVEALDHLLQRVPDVVLLDVEMPRLGGFELLAALRERPQLRDVRVIMLTSRASTQHKEEAMRLGASAYLIKPVPRDALYAAIHAVLAQPVTLA
jgi:chemosensory pili system protein ChpA (sensor histidine kinase/response regulator)